VDYLKPEGYLILKIADRMKDGYIILQAFNAIQTLINFRIKFMVIYTGRTFGYFLIFKKRWLEKNENKHDKHRAENS
jgi:hypothetical protein